MTPETYESGNRRAEIQGNRVIMLRVTGNVRRSKTPCWFEESDDVKKLRRIAKKWAFKGKLQ